jgi:hypothetical protein
MGQTMNCKHSAFALLIAPLFALSGCGERDNSNWVTGKLLKGGAKYVPPKGQLVSVTFIGLEIQDSSGKKIQGGEPFSAEVDQENGTFSVPGRDRRGIPPGKYRVAVTQKMTREAFAAANPRPKRGVDRETDMLADKFGLGTSPIIREVNRAQELTIDLDRPSE